MSNNATAPAAPAQGSAAGSWIPVGQPEDFPVNAGIAVKIGQRQIAVYRLRSESVSGDDPGPDEWYACDNACPHKNDNVLARGLVGDHQGELMVACPMHKKAFSLTSGACLNDPDFHVNVYPIKTHKNQVLVGVDAE